MGAAPSDVESSTGQERVQVRFIFKQSGREWYCWESTDETWRHLTWLSGYSWAAVQFECDNLYADVDGEHPKLDLLPEL